MGTKPIFLLITFGKEGGKGELAFKEDEEVRIHIIVAGMGEGMNAKS